MRIALTGGGTGGHFFPALAVARELKNIARTNPLKISPTEGTNIDLIFLGPRTEGENLLKEEGIKHKKIAAGKIRRYSSLQNFIDIFKIPCGLVQALWHLYWFMPNAVFSKGGYGSVPVVLAAWIYGIPVLIHESDSVPGIANKFCAKFSKRIAISFSQAAQYFPPQKTALTGNPVRKELLGGSKEELKNDLAGYSGLKYTLLILGGSQGSQAINKIIIESVILLLARCEIIHQCGKDNFEEIKKQFPAGFPEGYFPLPFLEENLLKNAYAAADIVISRAGATSIAEIAALGKPGILIPLPSAAGDHQNINAAAYQKSGACEIINQVNLTPHLFQDKIFSVLDNPQIRQKMSAAARHFNPQNATELIAEELLKIAKW